MREHDSLCGVPYLLLEKTARSTWTSLNVFVSLTFSLKEKFSLQREDFTMLVSILVSFYGLIAVVTAGALVCEELPFFVLLPLSIYPPAQRFCSSSYPLEQQTSTVTTVLTSIVSTTVSTVAITPGKAVGTESKAFPLLTIY